MNEATISFLNRAKSGYVKARKIAFQTGIKNKIQNERQQASQLTIDYTGQQASDLIKSKLLDERPCMISRFGSVELRATVQYLEVTKIPNFPLEKSINYILCKGPELWWPEKLKIDLESCAGFFPATDEYLEDFGSRMIQDIQNIDVLGSWRPEEKKLLELLKQPSIVKLLDLEPFRHLNPWSESLEGKVVLVIHPFEESIQKQYQKREFLFKDKRVLPEFDLKTFKAVQSVKGANCEFETWFDAFDWMCEEIAKIKFDIAIIGAGAYGLPLASYVKSLGKKSVHMGGGTQLLFGIKGKRWEKNEELKSTFYNQYWVNPLPSEVPNNWHHQANYG